MNTGFVKIYRKLLENTISSNLELLGLITALLLKANHKSNSFFLGTQKLQVLPGQFVSSQVKLSVEFGMQRNKMIRLLKILEDEKIVNIKGYSKYSLFTIVNREKYQSIGTASDTANDTASEQQVNTNKNDKNDQNEKEKIYICWLELRTTASSKLEGRGVPGFSIPRKFTKDHEECINKLQKKGIDFEDYKIALQNYGNEIIKRGESDYKNHRFTFIEFLKQTNGVAKFI